MPNLKVIADNRERNAEILLGLEEHGVGLDFQQLPIGDYIISDRICVERKTASDFTNSIIDTRLFDQAKRLHSSFEKPILVIEGPDSEMRLNRNVMLGAIAKLYIDYNIQVLRTGSAKDTAYALYRLAEHEQTEGREPRLAGLKRAYTDYQWQLLILSSIPGIGITLAKKLLEHFKTVNGVACASIDELKKVDKIGMKKAERIYKILNTESERI
ncbi:MAG: ERCC4 domain-containing protein [Candidatus Micrarchaeaceae archaeon]